MVGLGLFTIPEACKCNEYSNGRYTMQPYWTCTHGCKGCYARKGWRWTTWGAKSETPVSVDLVKAKKDYLKLKSFSEIEIAPSCDAFDLVFEKKYQITKKFLMEIAPLRNDIFFTFLSKSNIIQDYIEIIPKNSVVQITVESYKEKMETTSPKASSYNERLECVSKLTSNSIKTAIRIDPIIPDFDTFEDIGNIVRDFVNKGIQHITISTIKFYPSQMKDIKSLGLEKKIYKKTNNEYYIKDNLRNKYALFVKNLCEDSGISFAMCRETIQENSKGAFCDPFHLLPNYKPKMESPLVFKKITQFGGK